MLVGIGAKIKQLRTAKGMTLKDLSAVAGLSISYLSQLERGLNTIAIDSLANIAQALDVTLHYFIDQPESKNDDQFVMRSYERELFRAGTHNYIQYHLSMDKTDKTFLPRYIEILPTGDTGEMVSYHHGGEEFVYVLEGILTLHIKGRRYDMYPGDSAHYDSTLEHTWANYTSRVVKYICVHSPNPFQSKAEPGKE